MIDNYLYVPRGGGWRKRKVNPAELTPEEAQRLHVNEPLPKPPDGYKYNGAGELVLLGLNRQERRAYRFAKNKAKMPYAV